MMLKKKYPQSPMDAVLEAIKQKNFNHGLALLDMITPINDRWYVMRARCLNGLKNYSEAAYYLTKIKTDNQDSLITKARNLSGMGHFEEAIARCQQIPRWEGSKTALLEIAGTYRLMNQPETAIRFYQRIPDWESDPEALFGVARCGEGSPVSKSPLLSINASRGTRLSQARLHQEKKEWDDAIACYQSISDWERDRLVRLGIAHCFYLKGAYKTALSHLHAIPNGENDPQRLLALGHCLESMKQYPEAIAYFQQACQRDKNPLTAISLARCFEKTHAYEQALATYAAIPQITKHPQALISLARCHEQFKHYDAAIACYNDMPMSTTTQLSQGHCYEEKGDYDAAIAQYQRIPQWKEKPLVLLAIGRCYEHMEQYDNALATYHAIPSWKTTQTVLIQLAWCYEKMGNYQTALKTHETILQHDNSQPRKLAHARCYQQSGDYQTAMRLLKKIPGHERDPHVLLCLAHCAESSGDDAQAKAFFYAIPQLKRNTTALNSLARHYERMHENDSALAIYEGIPAQDRDRPTQINFARFYEKQGRHTDAIALYQSIQNWERDEGILLHLARCNESIQDGRAWALYQTALQHFPYSQDAAFQFCRYLIKRGDRDAETTLMAFKKKWPYLSGLDLLTARYQWNEPARAMDTLKNIMARRPYYRPAYIRLIQLLLRLGDPVAARQYEADCHERFKGNNRFFNQLSQCMKTPPPLLRDWNDASIDDAMTLPCIALPQRIQDAMALGGDAVAFLVGSTLLDLLNQTPLTVQCDIDIVVALDDVTGLLAKGFRPCRYNPWLYYKSMPPHHVEYYVLPSMDVPFVHHNALARDFTISSLYCDQQGQLYDPTGYGLHDAKHRLLRTVQLPEPCFADDPVRLLRAIKYILKGYRPTEETKQALLSFKPQPDYPLDHFHAVLRKQLRAAASIDEQHAYMGALQEYGVLKNVMGILPSDDIDACLAQIKRILESSLSEKNRFFTPADGHLESSRRGMQHDGCHAALINTN